MGVKASKTVLNNHTEEKREKLGDQGNLDNLATLSDVDTLTDLYPSCSPPDCSGDLGDLDFGDDLGECLECVSLPFRLILGICLG